MDGAPRKGKSTGQMQRDKRESAAAKGNKSGILRAGKLKYSLLPIVRKRTSG